MDEKKENKRKCPKTIVCLIVIAAIIACGVFAWTSGIIPNGKSGTVTTISESSLKEVLEISELSTIEYTYNAIAKAYAEDGTTIRYYVAYEGTVSAGIDFEKIKISVDEEQAVIDVILPEIQIINCNVEAGKLDYIFTEDKYNTAQVSAEAYALCLDDLDARASKEDKLFALARENAVSAIQGLIEPWIKQISDKYTVNVK